MRMKNRMKKKKNQKGLDRDNVVVLLAQSQYMTKMLWDMGHLERDAGGEVPAIADLLVASQQMSVGIIAIR